MSTALATIPSAPPVATSALAAYEPRDMKEAWQLAQYFAASRLLGEVTTPEACMLIMATGAELGIPATTALRSIYIIKGRPVVSADLKVSLCMRRRDRCEYFVLIESTDERATYETKPVGGQVQRFTFTMDDALRAQLNFSEGSNWKKYPKAMLRHRCSAELAQAIYPDVVLGLVSREELNDEELDAPRGPVVMDVEPSEPKTSAPAASTALQPDAEAYEDKVIRFAQAFSEGKSLEQITAIRNEVKSAGLKPTDLSHMAELFAAAQKRIKDGTQARGEREPGAEG